MLEAILMVVLLGAIIIVSFKRPKHFPPGPNGILSIYNLSYDPQKYFDFVCKEFGQITGFYVFGQKMVVVGTAKAISEVLSNESCQGRPDVCLIRDRFQGDNFGILFTDGDEWKIQRRFTLHHFRNLGFGKKTHESVILEECDKLLEGVEKLNGKPFNIEDYFYFVNINIIWYLIAGHSFPHDSKEVHFLREAIKDVVHSITIVGGVTVVMPFLRHVFPETTGHKELIRGSDNVKYFMNKNIKEHMETFNPEEIRDFIDLYIKEMKNDPINFNESELQGIGMDLLMAGSDTTTSTLTFAILFLTLRPDIQEKIYEEISSQIGSETTINYSHKNRLIFLEAFLLEILRYRTPAPTITPHRATQDTKLSGYHIPKDTVILMNVRTSFMDKEYWGDPEVFRPERFIDEDGKLKRECINLFPFGKGKRICLGETVARMTLFITIGNLVRKFNISLPPNHPVPDTKGSPSIISAPAKFQIICSPRISEDISESRKEQNSSEIIETNFITVENSLKSLENHLETL